MPLSAIWKLVIALVVGLTIVVLVPPLEQGGSAPPVGLLLLSGFLVGIVTIITLYFVLTRDVKVPLTALLYALAFNALIVVVKFVLSPYGIYEVNERVPLTGFFNVSDPVGAAAAALLVLILYVGVWAFIYRFFRRKLGVAPSRRMRERLTRSGKLTLVVLGGAILLAMAGGGIVLLVPLIAVGSGYEYLSFVFDSAASLLIAMILTAATALAAVAFKETADRAALVGDVGLLVSFFWIGLCFLALYQVLWVVYILVLTSIWPLKVVVPK